MIQEYILKDYRSKADDLKIIYDEIYKSGPLQYEIETFDLNGNCKIKFIRKNRMVELCH